MKKTPIFRKRNLPPAKEKAIKRALKQVLWQLDLQPHLTACKVFATKTGQVRIEFQPRTSNFNTKEIRRAAVSGIFPPGMTASDLAAIPAMVWGSKQTVLHLALSKCHLPPGITRLDLLETRGLDKSPAIFALFEYFWGRLTYPPELTARDLISIKSHKRRPLLHEAAVMGLYPTNTVAQDLIQVRDEDGWTALHQASLWGHLLPCTRATLISVKSNDGRTPWDIAVEVLNGTSPESSWQPKEKSVRNMLACPELAQNLDPTIEAHHETLKLLVASPKLTPKLRTQLAAYPKICAAML